MAQAMKEQFDKLKLKLDTNHTSSDITQQRDEVLAAGPTTPIENKAHFTHEAVGAAAAYEAFKAYENHEQHKTGEKPSHAKAKEILVGLATGFAVKMIEEKGLPFGSEHDKKKFEKEAQAAAARDSKRALRESGYYENHELEPIEHDEKEAPKVI